MLRKSTQIRRLGREDARGAKGPGVHQDVPDLASRELVCIFGCVGAGPKSRSTWIWEEMTSSPSLNSPWPTNWIIPPSESSSSVGEAVIRMFSTRH